MRKLALTATCLLTLLACELVARIALAPGGVSAWRQERAAFVQRVPSSEAREGADDGSGAAVERVHGADFVLHPFFGYTFQPAHLGTNRRGFYSGGPEFPYARSPDELVVGIFGGSVAMQVAGAHQQIADALDGVARARGFSRVTVLSFAIGGWRQPQHFNALVRFIDGVDVAILVDGFNEIIHLSDWHLQQQPAEYPWSAVYGVLAGRPSDAQVVARADLVRANRAAALATRLLDRSPLRNSAFAHLVWRASAATYEAYASAARAALIASSAIRDPGRATTPVEIAAQRAGYFALWHDLLLYSEAIGRARGRLFFHFVQPNQYDRGAKPLSEEERTRFTTNAQWFDEVTSHYATVRDMTARLRGEGVDSTFLGDLFQTTRETVYVDDCCHLNDRGIALLNDAIVRHVIASGRLDELAPHAEVARLDG